MASKGRYADVGVASKILGASTRHVARLGERGEILIPFRGAVDRDSIDRYLAERRGLMRGRAWDQATAWGAIAILSGLNATWLGDVQASRLRGRLRQLATGDDDAGAHVLVGKTRSRATLHTFETFDFLAPRIKKEIVIAGRRGLGLSTARREEVDGYLNAETLSGLAKRYMLSVDARGKAVLRVTAFGLTTLKRIATRSNVLGKR